MSAHAFVGSLASFAVSVGFGFPAEMRSSVLLGRKDAPVACLEWAATRSSVRRLLFWV